jgi:hypothetical protein
MAAMGRLQNQPITPAFLYIVAKSLTLVKLSTKPKVYVNIPLLLENANH